MLQKGCNYKIENRMSKSVDPDETVHSESTICRGLWFDLPGLLGPADDKLVILFLVFPDKRL